MTEPVPDSYIIKAARMNFAWAWDSAGEWCVMWFFRKKNSMRTMRGNPGVDIKEVHFVNAKRAWTEQVDTLCIAEKLFNARGFKMHIEDKHLLHPESGYRFLPQIVEFYHTEGMGIRTVSTIQIDHPILIPDGTFEFQHATGDSVAESVAQGLDQWLKTDLVPLLDALEAKPKTCTTMELASLPDEAGKTKIRRAVLGPVWHLMQSPPEVDAKAERETEEHPFCPCCLLTNSFEAFQELFAGDGFQGLRLLAVRDAQGTTQSDCRVNGRDWPKGAEALRKYAGTWPPAGYECRKQYVVLHTLAS